MRTNYMAKASIEICSLADRLVGEVMLNKGIKRPEARAIIAYEAGIAPGSLESLSRGRLKFTDRIASKLNALRIRKLEETMVLLQQELAMARSLDANSKRDIDLAEITLEEIRRTLRKDYGRGND